MSKILAVLAFSLLLPGISNAAEKVSPRWRTFYAGGYDKSCITKECFLAKLDRIGDPKVWRITEKQLLSSMSHAFGQDFRNMAELKTFVRSPEVKVRKCTFSNSLVDYYDIASNDIGSQRRDARDWEYCLNHQGGDRVLTTCAQGVADVRRTFLEPVPERKVEIVPIPEVPVKVSEPRVLKRCGQVSSNVEMPGAFTIQVPWLPEVGYSRATGSVSDCLGR